MWERFGFYGMQVLMVTYMIKKLGFVDTRANLVFGAAAALIYATPAIGGWIGDKLIGTRRTMRIGAFVLAFGYALLWLPTDNPYFLYLALGVIIVGNGLFKPNSGNLVRKIYEGDDTQDRQRIHHLLHGGEHRLDDLDDPDAVASRLCWRALRRLGRLAYRLRRVFDRADHRHDQLRVHEPCSGAHRLAGGRCAGQALAPGRRCWAAASPW